MKFFIIHDTWKSEAEILAKEIVKWCNAKGVKAELQPKSFSRANRSGTIVLVLGGDGFIMRQSKMLRKSKIPLLGINFGRKGIWSRISK